MEPQSLSETPNTTRPSPLPSTEGFLALNVTRRPGVSCLSLITGVPVIHRTGRGGVVGVYRQWCPVITVSTVQVVVEWSVFTGSGVRL